MVWAAEDLKNEKCNRLFFIKIAPETRFSSFLAFRPEWFSVETYYGYFDVSHLVDPPVCQTLRPGSLLLQY